MQKTAYKDIGVFKKFHDTIVGKDNITVLSFTENSITSNIWYASGPWDKPDILESARLLFPYAKHRVVFVKQFKEEDLPMFKLKRFSKADKELEYAD